MILNLSYVACDCCLTPAQPANAAPEARGIAQREEGFNRTTIDGHHADVCARCTPPEHDRTGCIRNGATREDHP